MTVDTSREESAAAYTAPSEPAAARALLSGLGAVVIWGLAPVATRAAVAQLAPLSLAMLRSILAALVFAPWAVRMLRRLDRAESARMCIAGALGMIGYNMPVAFGVQWLPASTAALVLATGPVWILLTARILLGAHAPRWAWIGSTVALVGVAVIAGPDAFRMESSVQTLEGLFLVLLGTALFGAYTVVLRPLSDCYGPSAATAASTVVGAIPYLALIGTPPLRHLATLPVATWGDLLFLAVASSVVGMLLWNTSFARIGSTKAGLLLFLQPVVGVTGALALLGERLSAGSIIGGGVLAVGVVTAWGAERRATGGDHDAPPRDKKPAASNQHRRIR